MGFDALGKSSRSGWRNAGDVVVPCRSSTCCGFETPQRGWFVTKCQNAEFTKAVVNSVFFQATPRPQRKSRDFLFICGTNNPPHPSPLDGTQRLQFGCLSVGVFAVQHGREHTEGMDRQRGPTSKLWTLVLQTLRWSKAQTPPRVAQCCQKFRNNRRLWSDGL